MRVFLMIANLVAAAFLLFWLRDEWGGIAARGETGFAIVFFSSAILLSFLNFFYIHRTRAADSKVAKKARDVWNVIKS